MAETSSLGFPALENPVNEFIQGQENKNTLSKTWRLMAFFKKKNEERKLGEIPPEQLNCFLSKFIVTSKRKDGDEFEPSSLRGFLSSFNRHLKACKYPKNIMEDLEFEQTRKVSEARSRRLKKERKGNKPNATEAMTG